MKPWTMVLPLFVGLLSCHKNDVDIAALNTNTFDVDFPGDNRLFTVDSIWTYQVGPDYAQAISMTVHRERFPQQVGSMFYVIELATGDTLSRVTWPFDWPDDTYRKLGVILGNEYCYRVDLRASGSTMRTEERCAVAEL